MPLQPRRVDCWREAVDNFKSLKHFILSLQLTLICSWKHSNISLFFLPWYHYQIFCFLLNVLLHVLWYSFTITPSTCLVSSPFPTLFWITCWAQSQLFRGQPCDPVHARCFLRCIDRHSVNMLTDSVGWYSANRCLKYTRSL